MELIQTKKIEFRYVSHRHYKRKRNISIKQINVFTLDINLMRNTSTE